MKRIRTILFALALILCLAACGNDTPVETEDAPQETTVEATRPEGTLPDATIPDATIPDVTIPDVTIPDVTIPDVTLPEEIDPSHTHSYADTVTRDATCTADGQRTYTCECGDSYTQPIPKLGHSYTDKVTAPTCTDKGYTTHTCTRCADSYRDNEKAAIGHSTTSKVTTAATCEKAGVKTITCSRCSYKTTENIAATGHSYAAATCVKAKTCTACGATSGKALGHSYTYKTTKTPTTSATGTLTGTCSRCTSKPTVTLPKLTTTDYTRTQTKAPTCTASGTDTWKWKTTTYGNISFTTSIAAKGHSWGSWKVITFANPIETGMRQRSCSACKEKQNETTATVKPYGSYFVNLNNYQVPAHLKGRVVINPRIVWWQDGKLYAECFIINDTNGNMVADKVNSLYIYNPVTNLKLAYAEDFPLDGAVIKPGEYRICTFVFSADQIWNYGANLDDLTLEW